LLVALGTAGWALLVIRTVQSIAFYALGPARDSVFLYDWRVYYAGALDLVARQLYRDGGIAVGNLKMPVELYNNPPLSAVLPIPLLPLGYEVGGLVWVAAGAVAVVAGSVLASVIVGARTALTWFGVFWLLYVIQPFFVRNMVLGNVNSFMLLVVIGFCWAHLAGRHRAAGILLGLATAIKVWPVLIALLLVREKRWRELGWAAGFVAVQGALLLVWLGPDVLPEMAAALRTVALASMLKWTRVAISSMVNSCTGSCRAA
jgi:alpha-1,2-mannosyltransferase